MVNSSETVFEFLTQRQKMSHFPFEEDESKYDVRKQVCTTVFKKTEKKFKKHKLARKFITNTFYFCSNLLYKHLLSFV